jgi:diamine N-acetyltransferase
MESHFEDAAAEPRAKPRMWSVRDGDRLIGFVMISDNVEDPGDDLVGPYYLWRLLVDAAFQGQGYGAATIDAVVAYLRTRPNADVLWTSCGKGEDGPLPFYLHYGFDLVGEVVFDDDDPEHLLRLDMTGS